jgi:hypothetical protein
MNLRGEGARNIEQRGTRNPTVMVSAVCEYPANFR